MHKVLITGIESFTGKHLSRYLQSNSYEVYGTSLHNTQDYFQCDITDKAALKDVLEELRPDYIIHLAAISYTAHNNDEDFYRVNTIATVNLLEVCREISLDVKKILLASSAAVYGNQGVSVLSESLCPKPINHYGASKYAMESLASNYRDKFNVICTRAFNYTGVGQEEHFLIPKIVKHYKEHKKEIELGNLEVYREFNSVEFVCEAYRRLLESDVKNITVNIASNRGIKLLDVIDMMNKIAGYTIEVKVNPKFVRKNEIVSLTGSSELLFKSVGEIQQKPFFELLQEMYEA